jgi:Na+/H+ antiporter NhaD/arsenite permease-like protein
MFTGDDRWGKEKAVALTYAQTASLMVFIVAYGLALTRKVKLAYIATAGAGLLIALGVVPWRIALLELIDADVLAIYAGFLLVSSAFSESGVPALLAVNILRRVHREKYALLILCGITALVSAFMHNVGAVLIMAPVAIELAKLTRSNLFPYLVGLAISSNAVTTVTMVADPPALILAVDMGMDFFDFFWYQGRPGLGTLSLAGVSLAVLWLLVPFRHLNARFDLPPAPLRVRYGATILFGGGVVALAFAPQLGVRIGLIGLAVGLLALLLEGRRAGALLREFDWDSFLFITGTFVLAGALETTGLLGRLAELIGASGLRTPAALTAFFVWISVAASAVVDNVPYTILMIPVVRMVAAQVGTSALPLLYGMVVGTGSGGNITPVGATANVFACGILEKQGCTVRTVDFMKLSVPFTLIAVAAIHLLIWLVWV